MDIVMVRTDIGLQPYSDSDSERLAKLPKGKPTKVSVGTARNILHHRKYFKLINTAWEYQPENVQQFYGSVDIFRKSIEMACGCCELIYSMSDEGWYKVHKSISFDSMKQEEFSDLYDRVIHLIETEFLIHLDEQDKANFFEILDGRD